ncbi:MAG: hypothetical protein QOD03_108 [Verrucomicrobiota bacterium]|jgi:cell division septum initiation protein DivIVA
MSAHTQALHSFARKLSLLLMFRGAMRWTTVWFFIWGVVVLAARIAGGKNSDWLFWGTLGFIPLAALAALREWQRRASFSNVRASYDELNQCGGVVMSEEVADMSAWQGKLPAAASPVLRWRSGRSMGLLAVSVLFIGVTLSLPNRLTAFAGRQPLQIGKLVGELKAEVQTLKEEKILEEKKAEELQKQVAKLQEQASGLDPNKTWEALDHIKESNSDLAKRAAEDGLNKLTSLSEAQMLASALDMAANNGMNGDTATRAAQELAGMLKAAKLDDGLLKGEIPPELLSKLDSLSKQDLQKLLSAIQFNKSNLGKSLTNLANLRLIDAKYLSQCTNAGACKNPNALAEYLSTCTNASKIASLCYGRGGPGGGGGTGPMTWQDKTSEDNLKFKEDTLPPSAHLSDAQFIGVSRSAPQLSDETVVDEHGALASAQGSGGSANSQVVLPRHKQAVQKFFKRDEK